MERRTVLKLIAGGVLPGSTGLVQIGCGTNGYRPEFFSGSEFAMLDALTEVVLPADDHSPGASAAKVAVYIDVMVADGGTQSRQDWRSGLDAVSELTRNRFARNFVDCGPAEQDEIVAEMAGNEESPQSAADRFFIELKRMTIDGYYTSRVGILDELGYRGNTAIDEFPGCTHEDHA